MKQNAPSPFSKLELIHVRSILANLVSADGGINRALYRGDHWLDGLGWIGPAPEDTSDLKTRTWEKIRRMFVSQNAIKEITQRHRSSLVGREPLFGLARKTAIAKYNQANNQKPTNIPTQRQMAGFMTARVEAGDPLFTDETARQEDSLIEEAEAALDTWFDRRGAHTVIAAAVIELLLSGRAPLRIFVPPGLLDDGGNITAASLEEALDYIYLQHPDADTCAVIRDGHTMQQGGVYLYRKPNQANGQLMAETSALAHVFEISLTGQTVNTSVPADPTAPDLSISSTSPEALAPRGQVPGLSTIIGGALWPGAQEAAETVYIENQETVFRTMDNAGPAAELRVDIGKRLPMIEMRADPLITPQIRQNQFQLNRTLTMMGKNVDLAGFLERVMTNAQEPTETVLDPATNEEVTRRSELKVGPATTVFLKGIPYQDENGNTRFTQPSVIYRDPVSPEPLIAAIKRSYQNMLQESRQTHVMLSGDVAISGEARRQAMADFVMSLLELRPTVERALRDVIETALALAAAFIGEPGKYEPLRATVDVRLEAGPMMAEDARMILEAVAQKIMSRETAMIRFNIEDTEAEKARIIEDLQDMMPFTALVAAQAAASGPAGAGGNQRDNNNPDNAAPNNADNSQGGDNGNGNTGNAGSAAT